MSKARSAIGWLPQAFGYEPSSRLDTYLNYLAWLKGGNRPAIDRDVRSVLLAVGLADRSGDRMRSLSGGMIRRAGLAQALLGQPRLLLLDEPTSGLDPAQRSEFYKIVRELGSGRCTVLSTHSLEDVEAVAERVLILSRGRLVWDGDIAQLRLEADGCPLREYVAGLMNGVGTRSSPSHG